ncbi:thiamine pyrophosphate-binding protein [Geomonas oryzae]|uniref:thiamine pyrophosphate-binding protein n=1 Tax=Geomonas oryzae TaxID=2364273 RepID=UPI00100BC2D4|nr:thiamine pyrophosphate-binding protein [Geomonas oryzae]
MEMRVSDYIAKHLADYGARTAFMLSGGGMMHLIDAVGREERIRYYCNHHEQASAMAAEGYARQTGKLAVCYGTSGPGGTNLVTGIAGAWLDSSPILFLTGQSKLPCTIHGSGISGLRQYGTFEVNIVPIVSSITKYSVLLDDPKLVRYHLEKAIHLATGGRPGPVLLDVPLDIQGARVKVDELVGFTPEPADTEELEGALLERILVKLKEAKRPLILAGHGINCAGRAEQFRTFASALNVPVVTTQLAKDLLPYDSPIFVGHPGVKGDRAGNFAVQNADLILSLGSSLHEQTTGYEADGFAPDAYKIQVEMDRAVLQREHVGVDLKVNCSVQTFLGKGVSLPGALADGGRETATARAAWLERCVAWKRTYAVTAEPHLLEGDINYYEFADRLSDAVSEDATVVTDAGSAFYVMGQAFKAKKGQRYIVSGALGAMGYALPASIGASVADPERTVVCVTGDGSLHLNCHELQVVRHHNLNLKLFVVNNGGYVSIRNTQNSFFNGNLVGASDDSGVSIPPLDKLAQAYGLPYLDCSGRDRLDEVLARALAVQGPVLVDIRAQYDQKIIPSVSSKVMPDGSMKSMPLHHMFPFLDDVEIAGNMKN